MVRGIRWMDNHSDTVLYLRADNNNEVDSDITNCTVIEKVDCEIVVLSCTSCTMVY